MKTTILVLALVGGAAALAPATQQPDTEVYLAAMSSRLIPAVYGPVVNISRNDGYDNQPSFTPDGSAILFTSNRDGAQTDIYRYALADRSVRQLTETPESEYSPLVTPDGVSFSVIRVEADGAQRLWRFNLDGSNPRLVLERVAPVGYHVWIDRSRLALFVLGGQGAPNTLQLADVETGNATIVTERIGRSLLMRPAQGTVSFISTPAEGQWMVQALDPADGVVTTIARTVDERGSQDMAWDPDTGRILMARGAQIWGWQENGGWRLLGNLGGFGLRNITRLAVNPDPDADPARRLVVVAEPAPR
jgi:Tol biopolymer transport system component